MDMKDLKKQKLILILASAVALLALIITLTVILATNAPPPEADTSTTADEESTSSTAPVGDTDSTVDGATDSTVDDSVEDSDESIPDPEPEGSDPEGTAPEDSEPEPEDTAPDPTDATDDTDSTSPTDPDGESTLDATEESGTLDTDTDADPADTSAGNADDDTPPELDEDSEAVLIYVRSGSGGYMVHSIEKDGAIINVPDTHDGLPVTEINVGAFKGSAAHTVTVADGVKAIGQGAFEECRNLKTVTIGKDVRELGETILGGTTSFNLFDDAYELACIYVREGNPVYSSRDGILYRNDPFEILHVPRKISGKVTVPEGITSASGFSYCDKITEIVLPSTVTTLGSFAGCTSLTELNIPQGVTRLPSFAGCASLTALNIPQGVTSLDSFEGCTSLTELNIPQGVTSLGTFEGCTSLTALHIPKTVISIGYGATAYCESLTSITVEEGNTSLRVENNCLIKGNDLVAGCNASVLSSDIAVTNIQSKAFCGLPGITSVALPETLKKIGKEAFMDCKNLSSIEWNDSLTSIGNSAFQNCGITSAIIPDGVKELDKLTFYGCEELATIHLGKAVATLYETTFYGCNPTTITVDSKNATYHAASNCLIKTKEYKVVCGNSQGTLPEEMHVIAAGAFCGRTKLTSLEISIYTTDIEQGAFLDCPNLRTFTCPSYEGFDPRYFSIGQGLVRRDTATLVLAGDGVTIPESTTVTAIDTYALSNCKTMESIYIPPTITRVSFYGCDSLKTVEISDMAAWINATHSNHPESFTLSLNGAPVTEVTVPAAVTEMSDGAFSGVTDLVSMTLHSGITRVSFYGCDNLKTVKISDLTAWISAYHSAHPDAFALLLNGTPVTEVTVPAEITQLKGDVFSGMKDLVSVTLHDGITSIGYSFKNCTSIKVLSIPASVTAIASSALMGMTSLEEIALPCKGKLSELIKPDQSTKLKKVTFLANSAVSQIASNALTGFTGVETVVLGEGITAIGRKAFEGCFSLKSISIPSTVTSVTIAPFLDGPVPSEFIYAGTKESAATVFASLLELDQKGELLFKCTDGELCSTDL